MCEKFNPMNSRKFLHYQKITINKQFVSNQGNHKILFNQYELAEWDDPQELRCLGAKSECLQMEVACVHMFIHMFIYRKVDA